MAFSRVVGPVGPVHSYDVRRTVVVIQLRTGQRCAPRVLAWPHPSPEGGTRDHNAPIDPETGFVGRAGRARRDRNSPPWPSWPATAAGPLTPTVTICGTCSNGLPITACPCWRQPDLTSRCTGHGWRNAVWPLRRSTGGCLRRAGSTAERISTDGSRPTRRNTCADPPCTPASGADWTEENSDGSSSPRNGSTTLTLRSLFCSA